MIESNEICASSEPTDEELFHEWCDELSETTGDIMCAMVDVCAEKLRKHGMKPTDVSYVRETLFSDATHHELWETIWNALMRA